MQQSFDPPPQARALSAWIVLSAVFVVVAACAAPSSSTPGATGGAAPGGRGGGGRGGGSVPVAGRDGAGVDAGGSSTDADADAVADAVAPTANDAAADRAPAADGAASPTADASTPSGRTGWTLVWADEFDQDGAPNTADWRYEAGFVRNEELQWYQPANARVANGVLTIEARREQVANPSYAAGSGDWKRNRQFAQYTSTSMTTAGKRTFTYGRFEARARIDVRQGSWPAFWTVGSAGGWPGGGEVDIMEFYAGKVLANVCRPMGSTCGWSSVTKSVATLGGAAWAAQFHVWAMEWDATNIDLFLDDVLMNHFTVASAVGAGAVNPYVGRPVYIIVNQAIGGINGGDPTGTTFPMKYEVDYVRVYQRAAP